MTDRAHLLFQFLIYALKVLEKSVVLFPIPLLPRRAVLIKLHTRNSLTLQQYAHAFIVVCLPHELPHVSAVSQSSV